MFRLITFITVIIGCYAASIPKETLKPILDSRIVGGSETSIQEFPHQVSMRYFGIHRCGGSIISKRVIITAAHCVDGISYSDITVNVGTTYRTYGRTYPVDKVIPHKGYTINTLADDIAILILSKNLKFTDSVRPIHLPTSGQIIKDGQTGFISGWGAVFEGYTVLPEILNYAKIEVINHDECKRSYRYAGFEITDNMICAGSEYGGRDSCQSDSGGPFISNGQVIGVVSFGNGCGDANFPGVYTNVGKYLKWIAENRKGFD